MEAAFASFFLAPRGLRPGLGGGSPPSRAARLVLLWEWFRIYFESGVGKLLSGDPEWRHLTAMDHYYEYGPLPTWIGWWAQHLPHGFHAATAFFVLAFECVLVFLAFLPRPFRLAAFVLSSLMQVGIEATANYTFLNLLVLFLGFLLLEDRDFRRAPPEEPRLAPSRFGTGFAGVALGLQLYATFLLFPLVPAGLLPSPLLLPVVALEPFRVAGRYGLFAVMTSTREEIEFQGSSDGTTWVAYPFRFKPQALDRAPGIYAPYHPRFEWNLWFASLGTWEGSPWVETTEERLLAGAPDVLRLFAHNPFAPSPPAFVRAVIARYSFTTVAEYRKTGRYWRREGERLYAPVLKAISEG
ncbi:MAG TPA: lipase maturation factor family protein, partial [Vicinamibacteria bacterium]|nr:lipase maturation factor family protein [Vicinamibacteria bacterium]